MKDSIFSYYIELVDSQIKSSYQVWFSFYALTKTMSFYDFSKQVLHFCDDKMFYVVLV